MPTASTIALFSLAAIALAVVPGPAVAYIVTQSVDKGRRAGLVSALGVASGGIVHVAAATIGLSALIASSATAFTTIKLVGAAYLIVVGLRRILGRDNEESAEAVPAGLRRLYTQGAIVNVLNPKTALFFLAFLPQFIDSAQGAVWAQILVLGLIFACLGALSDGCWALVAGTLGDRLRRSARFPKIQRYVSGSVFVGLGAVAALSAPAKQT
jgi:threonine/homoserine/homoserine lactone efflux protein